MGYTIINASEAESLDYSQLPFTNKQALRHSLNGEKVAIKWIGDKPSFLNGTVDYTHEEMITILQGDEWIEIPTEHPAGAPE